MKSKILMKYRSLLVRVYSIAFRIIGLLPRNEKLIIFESYSGKQFSCNPRAIFEYLEENKDKYDYRLIWSIDKRNKDLFDNLDVKYLKRFSLKWLWYMATAKYWITNSRLPLWIPKPRKTTYVQTWHGTPLKKLANDMDEVHMPGTTTEQYKKNFLKEASKWDYLISPNAYSTEIFRSAFQFKKEIIESGYPRNDLLYAENRDDISKRIKRKLNIDDNKKIILYAPTWRDNEFYGVGKYKFDLQLDLEELQKEFEDSAVFLLRMHYLVRENFNLQKYHHFIKDVSLYQDIRDLYLISDILITDYSSVFFDFGNLKKPIIFYTYDLELYRDKLRGFYFDFEQNAPGEIVVNKKELYLKLKNIIQMGSIPNKYNQFYNEFCSIEDGFAAKRVIERIF
ncbi:CDP-glycerol glycerophosphotransferase family protein [Bacillus subtilis]|uniref:CDP-glycerol glycerophosphotransferase family protein n=1 Tax=Bacillus subtilis TaxID=1423 RepID=UPI000419B824|nr:CDP-glycerol glycerophosphotransferase family protein [Bacillus subtilis]MBU8593036.1 CDP-glycerol glycerophosphotransferase family protein [Bacillus subtilis]MBU8709544.1 CDP-glycerol glycerophosphotransferase family protein [Bacillus subtilis]MBU8804887.1 CDP-glycerol glycerophosphotransferase family protein [Bacillus subtilis]MBY0127154.1 CDP-glycerol glycerophosphotransferase family protein [Bacillus subtilis]MCA1174165.1 CDP-glycerol glycerophosphotransferase family protein [Bacillus s